MAHVDDRSNLRPEHIQMTQGHDEGRRHLLAQKYIALSPTNKISLSSFNTQPKKKKHNQGLFAHFHKLSVSVSVFLAANL